MRHRPLAPCAQDALFELLALSHPNMYHDLVQWPQALPHDAYFGAQQTMLQHWAATEAGWALQWREQQQQQPQAQPLLAQRQVQQQEREQQQDPLNHEYGRARVAYVS